MPSSGRKWVTNANNSSKNHHSTPHLQVKLLVFYSYTVVLLWVIMYLIIDVVSTRVTNVYAHVNMEYEITADTSRHEPQTYYLFKFKI